MRTFLQKISLCAATYYHARRAIARQFDSEAVKRGQNLRLQALVRYVFDHTKYYRELFEQASLRPEHIKTAGDLHRIPILTRAQLRDRFWDLLPRELPPSRVARTSGSTGMPVCVLSDDQSRMHNAAAIIRLRQAVGVGFAFRPILTPLKTPDEPACKRAHWTFLQGVHKTFYINPYVTTDESTSFAIHLAKRVKEPALVGITPAIRTLAFNIRDGLFPSFRPRVVMTIGETLTAEDREFLETTFQAKVVDDYACSEVGNVAWQCLEGAGYHINADNVIVEILDKDGLPATEGQVGEVVLTSLHRRAMPIIRYKNGDIASFTDAECQCGCKLPTIAELHGRTGEDFTLPDGKKVPWHQLKSLMNHPQIRRFQLVQDVRGDLVINYVLAADTSPDSVEKLLEYRFGRLLGGSISISARQVPQIAPLASGKMKLVVSHFRP